MVFCSFSWREKVASRFSHPSCFAFGHFPLLGWTTPGMLEQECVCAFLSFCLLWPQRLFPHLLLHLLPGLGLSSPLSPLPLILSSSLLSDVMRVFAPSSHVGKPCLCGTLLPHLLTDDSRDPSVEVLVLPLKSTSAVMVLHKHGNTFALEYEGWEFGGAKGDRLDLIHRTGLFFY